MEQCLNVNFFLQLTLLWQMICNSKVNFRKKLRHYSTIYFQSTIYFWLQFTCTYMIRTIAKYKTHKYVCFYMPVFWMPNYASSLTRFLAHIVCIILIYPYVFRLLFQHHARVCLPKTIIHQLDKKMLSSHS